MKIVHNNNIPQNIRQDNDLYNHEWIIQNNMLGDEIVPVGELDVCKDQKIDANSYMTVWLQNIDRLFNILPSNIDLTQYSLVDVGCGSGISTIYIRNNYPLKYVCGFDFSFNLIRIAKLNKEKIERNDLEFFVSNAKETHLSYGKTILFLFNPFGIDTLRGFIDLNIDMLRHNNSFMLYANDIFVNEMENRATIVARDDFFNLSVLSFSANKSK